MTERVTYYSNIEGSIFLYLPRIESLLVNFNAEEIPESIDDIIELYHVTLFIRNKHFAETWTVETIADFANKVSEIDQVVRLYFLNLQPDKIKETFFALDFTYQETFWAIINRYKIWSVVSPETLKDILEENDSVIHKVLLFGTLVAQYESVIVEYFKSHPKTAEILLSVYVKLDNLLW